MKVKDNIEWLKSLKKQIGQTQHIDLWHFEQVIDETISNLEPLAEPHGRLIDADRLYDLVENRYRVSCGIEHRCERDLLDLICEMPTIIEAEVSE